MAIIGLIPRLIPLALAIIIVYIVVAKHKEVWAIIQSLWTDDKELTGGQIKLGIGVIIILLILLIEVIATSG